ncbi:MAG: DUF1934 family protein [bacterium]
MIVNFKMIINDETIEFNSIGKLNENVLSFKDMNNKQNIIDVYILEEQVIIIQDGTTKMKNEYILNKKTEGYYSGAHNVEGVTHCITHELKINPKEIYIKYDFYFNNQLASNNILLIKY